MAYNHRDLNLQRVVTEAAQSLRQDQEKHRQPTA
jgi:hypothetical protein